ncbi:MAG TPA: glutamate--tRNA ligase [Dehalococcoidia bacterium]|nr:glutamate--tRNA ligase [Dehalococcoidia bacterium]
MTVRVRLAPSPTGEPHVGTLRTAIFDWLLARHEGGECIVRVEDTDRARYSPEAVDSLMDALDWLQIPPDEGPGHGGPYGPYVQSERLALYHEATDRLLASGHAYRCYCTPHRLDEMRQTQQATKQPPHYDRRCRWLTDEERVRHEAAGESSVVRFKVPEAGQTRVHDLIRGEIVFANASQDDFVILKSDSYPTYHLAVVVDDHAMKITHVLRGDEWLASFPKHVMLYEALQYEQPVFAHLPLILGPDRKKLSKRHGDTAFSAFRKDGYLPEAMFNFLGLLGWSLDDKTDIIARDEFVANFTLERINKSPAVFDMEKLRWMNGHYIRSLPVVSLSEYVAERLEQDLPPEVPRPLDLDLVRSIVPLIQERTKLLSEVAGLTGFFFSHKPYDYDLATLLGKRFAAEPGRAAEALDATLAAVGAVHEWSAAELEAAIEPLAEAAGVKRGELYGLIRVAVTGRAVTPPLFESMEILGRARCLECLDQACRLLAGEMRA